VGIVGAFSSTCQNQIPAYVAKVDEIKSKGIDEIAVISVNDHAVLKAFEKAVGSSPDKITFLADFDGSLTKHLGMEIDLTTAKYGKRSNRYAMLVDNGVITKKWVEDKPSELKVSSAENIAKSL